MDEDGGIAMDGGQRQEERAIDGKINTALTKKLSPESEAAVILVGAVSFIEKPVSIFIRLANPLVLADMPEVDIPTR